MLLPIIIVLVVFGVVIALAKGKGKISTKWQPLTDYVLAMIGVFVGVTVALLLTEFSTYRSEREKTVRLLFVAAEDIKRYQRDFQKFPIVYKDFKDKSKSESYGIAEYLNKNPRRIPTLPKLLITSEYALAKLHPKTIRELGDTLANLQKLYEIIHHDDFTDDKLPLYIRLMDTETKVAIGLIDLEVGYQKGLITDEMIIERQQALMDERLRPHGK